MYRKYVYNKVTWYDFRDIHQDEAIEVCNLYGLENAVVRLILSVSTKNKVREFKNCITVSMDFPCSINTESEKRIIKKPVHFVLGDGFIITVRFDEVRGFREAKKTLVMIKDANDSIVIFAALLSRVYEHIHHDLGVRLPEIAKTHRAYAYKKYLIDYSRMVRRHEDIIEAFRAVAAEFFVNFDTEKSFEQILADYKAIEKKIDQQRGVHLECVCAKAKKKDKSFLMRLIDKLTISK